MTTETPQISADGKSILIGGTWMEMEQNFVYFPKKECSTCDNYCDCVLAPDRELFHECFYGIKKIDAEVFYHP